MAQKNKKSPKRKRKVMTIAEKLKILNLIEKGETIAAIARHFTALKTNSSD